MNAELIRIRKNKQLVVRTSGDITTINPDSLLEKIVKLNTNMSYLYSINGNSDASIDDYIEKITKNIYLVLDIFSEMSIYPDYFYDIYFKINDEYRTLASAGKVNGRKNVRQVPEFSSRISYMMEKGLNNGNYQLNPTRVKNISEYYNEMVDFSYKYYLPYEVRTVEMCKEMFAHIYNDVSNCINNIGNSPYISDDVESLSIILFNYIQFFAAIGVNPKKYLDECIDNQEVLGKSK